MNFKKPQIVLILVLSVILLFLAVFLIIYYTPKNELELENKKPQIPQIGNTEVKARQEDYELSPEYKKIKQAVFKQLTFLQTQDYNLETLKISNFYPKKVETSNFGLGSYPHTATVHCLPVSNITGKKESYTLNTSLYLCASESETKTLNQHFNESGQSFILENNLVLNLTYREKFNAINKEEEFKIFNNLRQSWLSLQETPWPNLDNFNPFDVYTFNSGYYSNNIVNGVMFTPDVLNRNYTINTSFLVKLLDGQVIVSDFGLKDDKNIKQDLLKKYQYYEIAEENYLENNIVEYFLFKKELETVSVTESKYSARSWEELTCNLKVIYLYKDILFEFIGKEKKFPSRELIYADGIDGLTCYDELEKNNILEEARFAINFILLPLKNEKVKILDRAYSYNSDDYYLFDLRLKLMTDLSVNCVEDIDCKLVDNKYDNYLVFSISKENTLNEVNSFVDLVENYAQQLGLKPANIDGPKLPYKEICDAGVCSFILDK